MVVREELFQPEDGASSMSMQVEIDCSGGKLRLHGVKAFSLHNLRGTVSNHGSAEGWVAPERAAETAQLEKLCNMARAARTEAPADVPPPPSLSAADIQTWAEHYLDLEGWRVIQTSTDGINLAPAAEAPRTADTPLKLWTRSEFFRPEPYPEGGPASRRGRSGNCWKSTAEI
jgi:hypothetical protein